MKRCNFLQVAFFKLTQDRLKIVSSCIQGCIFGSLHSTNMSHDLTLPSKVKARMWVGSTGLDGSFCLGGAVFIKNTNYLKKASYLSIFRFPVYTKFKSLWNVVSFTHSGSMVVTVSPSYELRDAKNSLKAASTLRWAWYCEGPMITVQSQRNPRSLCFFSCSSRSSAWTRLDMINLER